MDANRAERVRTAAALMVAEVELRRAQATGGAGVVAARARGARAMGAGVDSGVGRGGREVLSRLELRRFPPGDGENLSRGKAGEGVSVRRLAVFLGGRRLPVGVGQKHPGRGNGDGAAFPHGGLERGERSRRSPPALFSEGA